jgi:hypothetical protein
VPRKTLTFDFGVVMDGSETVPPADADRVYVRSIPEKSDPASISNVASAHVSGAVFQRGAARRDRHGSGGGRRAAGAHL